MSRSNPAASYDIENQQSEEPRQAESNFDESAPLISQTSMEDFFTQTSKSLFEMCRDEKWRVADGFLNASLGGAFVGMSTMQEVADSQGMMAIHAVLGGVVSAKIIRTLAEAGNSIYYRNSNLTESAVEINLFKKLAELSGKTSCEPLIEAINQALEKSGAPSISEDVLGFLKEDPQAKNFVSLTEKVSEISNYKILALSAVLGIACTAAGAASMALTLNSTPAAIATGLGLATSSIASSSLNAAAASPHNIADNTYKAIKAVNEKFFTQLKEDVEAGFDLPENLEELREEARQKSSRGLKTTSSAKVAISDIELTV